MPGTLARVAFAIAPSRQLLRILAIAIVLALLPSCLWREPVVGYVNPALMPQLRLSVTGPQIAAAVLERTRELKLTTDGGQTWQTIPPAAVADAFECITMLDGRRGWALNHQGQVFSTDSGGEKWTRISELHEFTCS